MHEEYACVCVHVRVCVCECVWVCECVHLSLSVTDLFVFEHVCVWKGVREYMCWCRLSCLSASLRLLSASTRHVCVSVKPYVLDMWYWYVSWKLSVFSRLCVCVFVCLCVRGRGESKCGCIRMCVCFGVYVCVIKSGVIARLWVSPTTKKWERVWRWENTHTHIHREIEK